MGMTERVAGALAEYYPAAAQGHMDIRSDDIAEVTGRPATTYLEFLRNAVARLG